MIAASDPIARLAGALDQTGAIIAAVRPEQAALPTPCRAWDVRGLVNHVVQDVQHFTAMVSGAPWEPDDVDVIGDDWARAYRTAADALLAAWGREGALDGTVQLPFGPMPAAWCVGQQISDLVVHGWDIATATGQPTDLDPELGQEALEWARQNLQPQFRGDEESGHSFGPEVSIPDDAPLHDRLAAFFGRTPRPRVP
jgi:uncharacterized protein (TIGR03086 family)